MGPVPKYAASSRPPHAGRYVTSIAVPVARDAFISDPSGLTSFGLGDVSEGYVLDLFVRMPNGPFFNSYNDVAAYFAKAGAQ